MSKLRLLHILFFWSQFLTNFDVTPLKSKLRTSSTRICSDYASMMPIRGPKMAKNADIGNFCSIFFTIFDQFRGVLSLPNLAYLVEEVLSFKMSGVTPKSVKNWLQYWRNSDYSLCRGMGFLPLDSWDHAVTLVYTGLAAASSIQGREVGRVRYTHPWIGLKEMCADFWFHSEFLDLQRCSTHFVDQMTGVRACCIMCVRDPFCFVFPAESWVWLPNLSHHSTLSTFQLNFASRFSWWAMAWWVWLRDKSLSFISLTPLSWGSGTRPANSTLIILIL